MAEVVYLTGAPATGKSTLTTALKAQIPDLQIFEFGERLTARLTGSGQVSDQADLRSQSARAIALEGLAKICRRLNSHYQARRPRARA